MGYYIETPEDRNKAKQLHQLHGAVPALPLQHNFDGPDALICVVENGPFDAAAVAYDADERDAFIEGANGRPTTWLNLPKKLVLKLQPALKDIWEK